MWHLDLDIDQPVDFFTKIIKYLPQIVFTSHQWQYLYPRQEKKCIPYIFFKFKCGSLSTNETEEFEVEIKNE